MRQLEEAFADPEIAAVIGSYDRHPRAGNFLSQLKNLSHRHVHQSAREEAFTFWGACGAVRREAFDAVGGFDERYRAPSIEDIELGYRLRRAGYRIRLLKTLEVTHLKRWTIRGLLRTDIVGRAWPWSKLLLREGRIENDLNVAWRGRAAVAAAGCLVLALALSPWVAAARAGALLASATLLVLDAPLLQYLAAERGWTFAVRAIPWRWLAHACSGATFGLAAVHWWVRDRRLG